MAHLALLEHWDPMGEQASEVRREHLVYQARKAPGEIPAILAPRGPVVPQGRLVRHCLCRMEGMVEVVTGVTPIKDLLEQLVNLERWAHVDPLDHTAEEDHPVHQAWKG